MPLHEFTPSVQKKEMESEIQAVKRERERKGRNISATILRVLLRNHSNIFSKVEQASFETSTCILKEKKENYPPFLSNLIYIFHLSKDSFHIRLTISKSWGIFYIIIIKSAFIALRFNEINMYIVFTHKNIISVYRSVLYIIHNFNF